jgi:hypothetical protein
LPFFARFNANRNFHSGKLDSYEAGYRRLLGRNVYFDLAGFFNQYSDLFSEDITGSPFVETAPPPTHILLPAELRGSYSFLHMSIRKGPNSLDIGSAPATDGESPQHQVLLQSSFDLPKRVTFDFDYRYVSKLAGISIPAYSTADARLAWTFRNHWELSAAGRNLLQPGHFDFASDPGPQRRDQEKFLREAGLDKQGKLTQVTPASGFVGFHSARRNRALRPRLALLAAIFLGSISLCPSGIAQQSKPEEYQVKAVYLYNFGRFVVWPGTAAATQGTFDVCVLGRDPFGSALDATLAGEAINNRKLTARRIAKADRHESAGKRRRADSRVSCVFCLRRDYLPGQPGRQHVDRGADHRLQRGFAVDLQRSPVG